MTEAEQIASLRESNQQLRIARDRALKERDEARAALEQRENPRDALRRLMRDVRGVTIVELDEIAAEAAKPAGMKTTFEAQNLTTAPQVAAEEIT